MQPELSDEHRKMLRQERRAFVWFCSAAAVATLSLGGGWAYLVWKTEQLKAAGLWPQHYGHALTPASYGVVLGVLAGMIAFHNFVRWLQAIRSRRRLTRVECATSAPFQR